MTRESDPIVSLGNSLAASFQAFSAPSPWNTPIPANPSIHRHSRIMIVALNFVLFFTQGLSRPQVAYAYREWTAPVHVIDSDRCPQKDAPTTNREGRLYESVDPDGNGIAGGIPLPDGVWADPREDGRMVLVDPNKRLTWEFSRARALPNGQWEASVVDRWYLDGPGHRRPGTGTWWVSGARGSGSPYLAGLIRIEEIRAGVINHALAVATPINRRRQLCAPTASRTDG